MNQITYKSKITIIETPNKLYLYLITEEPFGFTLETNNPYEGINEIRHNVARYLNFKYQDGLLEEYLKDQGIMYTTYPPKTRKYKETTTIPLQKNNDK